MMKPMTSDPGAFLQGEEMWVHARDVQNGDYLLKCWHNPEQEEKASQWRGQEVGKDYSQEHILADYGRMWFKVKRRNAENEFGPISP